MKLLYTKRSPYARKVRVLALEKKIVLDFVEEDLMNKSQVLWQNNPVGKIPVLVLDNGETLVDSPVICEYLDTISGRPYFIPKSRIKRFRALHLEAVADGLMDVTVAAYMEKARHGESAHGAFILHQEDTIKRCLAFFNEHVKELKKPGIASVSVACAIGYIQFRFGHLWPQEGCETLAKWYENFSKRESLQQTVLVTT